METTITEFLSNEYKDYSIYTIESRAIPSAIDGLKPSQRKIIYVSNEIWKTGAEKALKVFQLSGAVANRAYYHHGAASLENAITNMAQSFKNSLPLLEEHGQFGSLRSPKPGAPRYIGTKLSKNFRLLYKDFELLENKQEEGEEIEPNFFLPIIPTVLLNGSSGIAVGFASNILNRNTNDLIDSCALLLKGKEIAVTTPFIKDFRGEFINDTENHKRWIIRGVFTRVNLTTVKVSELPPSMTLENYEALLDKLVDNKVIVSYEDNCDKNIDYTIKFTREDLAKLTDDKIIKLLKLEESETEIFTTLDEHGKIMIFETDKEIIEYFVNFRLGYYFKRKEFILSKLRHDLKILTNRGKYIKAILDSKIDIKNKSKDEMVSDIVKLNLEMIDDSYDYLLRMPIYSLTKELFEKLKQDFTAKKTEIAEVEKVEPTTTYLEDLKELKTKVNKK
jgi:DNA topoisomerase II